MTDRVKERIKEVENIMTGILDNHKNVRMDWVYQLAEAVDEYYQKKAVEMVEPSLTLYEKYKHLDKLFSDEQWLDTDRPQQQALFEMWQAIKAIASQEGLIQPKGQDDE